MRARDWRNKAAYTYGLHGTPTTFTLEERIAALEGGRQCVLAPSGLAAIALVDQALLAHGDEVLLPDNVYGPSRELARTALARWGITHRLYDPMDAAALAAMIGPRTKLVWLEAAGSVTMEFPDLTGLINVARSRGVTTALDNTWGAGIAFCGFDLGIDIVMQALTKFPSGAANDAELVLRSLATVALRYYAQDAAGRQLATWLAARPEVRRVLHPALEGAPGHDHWRAHCTAAAGLFSVLFDARFSSAQVDRFVDALRLFRIGYSWAGPMSLVVPYDLAAMRPDAVRERGHLHGHLVRFSVGLEAAADLQADLEQALAAALGTST